MASQPRTVRPRKAEVAALQSAMRDVQVSINDYYKLSSGVVRSSESFTTPVRSTVAFIQKVNDVLRSDFAQQHKFRRIFKDRLAAGDRGAMTMEGVRYVRNVGQHLIHPVAPSAARVVGGMRLGYRTSAIWSPVPKSVHARLRPETQALKPYFDACIIGNSVADTFLDAARFVWEVCPLAVHRQDDGEWTGFPLRHQAGVSDRLHPEEPVWHPMDPESVKVAVRWMNRRRPGGDCRVICGRVIEAGIPWVFGLTFRQGAAYTQFFEMPEQVRADIDLGYPYHSGSPAENLKTQGETPDYGGTFPAFLFSPSPLAAWAGEPITTLPAGGEYSTYGSMEEFWRPPLRRSIVDPLVRREHRLAAWFPIR